MTPDAIAARRALIRAYRAYLEAEAVLEIAQAFAANDRASERLIEAGASLSQAMGRFDTI